jgi:hypothetical protein
MEYEEGLRRLQGRTKIASALIWAVIATGVLMAGGEVLEAFGYADTVEGEAPLDLAVGVSYVLFLLALLGSVVAVAMWIHRAHANLREAGVDGLEFTPGWAVGWYFVPFANLVKPFQAMRELWTASHSEYDAFGAVAPAEIKVWWGCWIVGNILSNASARVTAEAGPTGLMVGNLVGAAGTVLTVAAAVLLLKIIQTVYAAQRGGATARQVFA